MNLKYEDLHYSDLGASLRNFNDVIKTRKQGDMPISAIKSAKISSTISIKNTKKALKKR